MDELINKTELMNDLKKDIAESDNWLVIAIYLAIIVRITSYKNIDAVEVIRCEDCVFWKSSVDVMVCDLTHGMKCASDYCSYAVRRKE